MGRNHYLCIDIVRLELINNKKNCVLESFENFDDEKCMSYYTEYQNSDTNETDIYESPEDASQLQRVDSMFGNSPYIGELNINKFNIKLRVL